MSDLQQQMLQTRSELQSVRAQIAALQRNLQLAELTKGQIQSEVSSDERVWQAVGRMFVASTAEKYNQSVEGRGKEIQQQIDALNKKQRYYEVTVENLTNAMKELSA